MRINLSKKCPRCKTKMDYDLVICPNCQLNFKKFNSATNLDAKIAIKEGRSGDVLLRKGCPSDVKQWVLILITFFGGLFGLHYYYVGRYKMGIFFTLACLVGVINSVITMFVTSVLTGFLWELFSLLVLVWGFVIFMWIIDVAKVCLNKFKIPVSRN